MIDQNFGHKELYEVVLRAKTSMQFGERYVEEDEPVLIFDNVQMSVLSEQNRPIMARGGFGNMPRVIWDDRSEVTFQMVDGVMSAAGMGILFSANVTAKEENKPLYIHQKEGPLKPDSFKKEINGVVENVPYVYLTHKPLLPPIKKAFVFYYDWKTIQQKIYGLLNEVQDGFGQPAYKLELYTDKNFTKPAEKGREYLVDYYYEYRDEALLYAIKRERFNGLFTLEAKFYSKDENEGDNYTNLLYMPKVRIVSNINLRLGERADPTVSTFNIIGLPETVGDQKNLIMEITRLGQDVDADI